MATHAAAADEAERWQALFDAVPALPATPAQALQKIAARRVEGQLSPLPQLRIEVADARLRALQHEVDTLFEPTSKAAAAQVQATLAAVEKDPVLTELGRKIDQSLKLQENTGQPPTAEEWRKLNSEVERVLGPAALGGGAASAPPLSDIAAYRLELQRSPPRLGQFLQRLFDLQRAHAQQHAQADREAIARLAAGADAAALARELVQRHQTLADRQLIDATMIVAQAREAMAPRFARMARIVRAAELRNAPPGQRNEGYAVLKAYVEMLLTLQRETLQDVGFWAGTRVAAALPTAATAGARSLYEQSLAPGFELRANGELPTAGPHYPAGRAIVVGLAPGIR
jgi:hypothetical protein